MINTSFLKNNQQTVHTGLIIMVWTLVQLLLFKRYGLNLEGEGIKYFRETENFLSDGKFSSPKYWFYSTYIFIHLLFKKAGAEIIGVYIFQSLLNLTAILIFYRALVKLLQNRLPAFIFCLYLASLFPLQQFNTYLYTESLFISLSILWASALIFSANSLKNLFWPILLALILLFTRPTGIYFCVITLIWIFLILYQGKKYSFAALLLLGGVFCSVLFVNSLMKTGGELDFWLPFEEKHILCGVPTGRLAIEKDNHQSLSIFFKVFSQQPAEMSSLMFQRAASFWKTTRDYYSTGHNFLHMLWFYPLFLAALLSLRFIRKNIFVQTIFFASAFFTLTVMLSCDDWMNRFMLPLVPLLIVAAAIGTLGKWKVEN